MAAKRKVRTASFNGQVAPSGRKGDKTVNGADHWDDEGVMAERRRHVREELADLNAFLILDPGAFPKTGTESCGVVRLWCGRLG